MSQWRKPLLHEEQALRKNLLERVTNLTAGEARVALDLIDQLVVCFDPDIVDDFKEWHEDPRLSSILQLVARLDDDLRDQVLFFTEDLFASENTTEEQSK